MAPAAGFFWDYSAQKATPQEAPALAKAKAALGARLAHLMQGGGRGFAEEYERLSLVASSSQYTASEGASPPNAGRNRYRNILPYDYNRVRLATVPEGGNYINASLVRSGGGESPPWCFIASQGPLKGTVEDFWRMVLEQRCSAVVMLTQAFERRVEKCAPYFPQAKGSGAMVGRLQVCVEDLREVSTDITVRAIRVSDPTTGMVSTVQHYHYHKWPDHGVPEFTKPLRDLINLLEATGAGRAPILVHCSAGVGRTGTFCAVYVLLQRLYALLRSSRPSVGQIERAVDVPGVVARLRRQRMGMVQTVEQYYFCYQAVIQEVEAEMMRRGG
ncbi:unnamed protein product [Ostreobium quekettii]|uniref:Protein tyrosine phosphatase n=1 Tax=Ostreobium quekettii TaxID=121088 RepID=A0A8S1JAG0_9CHLO|nr:unnamed protein product [Ostreobium quekettii]|eukprot:evm.model.scf_649.2 EVM.evm.TU.scf_649.2   scf_649:14872-16046(-)